MLLRLLREGLGRLIVLADLATRPRPLQRPEAQQRAVDEAARSLVLYQFFACPFCVRTRRAIHRLNLPIQTRDARHDRDAREALRSEGGTLQVPCLRIEEAGEVRWLYESAAIIEYLDRRFGPRAAPAT